MRCDIFLILDLRQFSEQGVHKEKLLQYLLNY